VVAGAPASARPRRRRRPGECPVRPLPLMGKIFCLRDGLPLPCLLYVGRPHPKKWDDGGRRGNHGRPRVEGTFEARVVEEASGWAGKLAVRGCWAADLVRFLPDRCRLCHRHLSPLKRPSFPPSELGVDLSVAHLNNRAIFGVASLPFRPARCRRPSAVVPEVATAAEVWGGGYPRPRTRTRGEDRTRQALDRPPAPRAAPRVPDVYDVKYRRGAGRGEPRPPPQGVLGSRKPTSSSAPSLPLAILHH